MRTIYKYELEVKEEQIFEIAGPIPLSVGAQGGHHNERLVLWCITDDTLREQKVRVIIRGTGHLMRYDDGKFLGTAQMPSGLVWHVFFSIYNEER